MSADPEPDMSERRRDPRFGCDGSAEVVVFHPTFLFRGLVRNISRRGCFVETHASLNLPPNAEVELRFSADGEQLASLAFVMGVQPGKGVGFQFVPGDPRMDESFLSLIDRLSEAESQGLM